VSLGGTCCADGDCLCHGPAPTELTSANGPFQTSTFTIETGTVHYPTDAPPPFAAVALCGGFLNTGPEMEAWGPFYASHGIVTVITTTTGADLPDLRARKLLASIWAVDAENTRSGSPLNGKLAGRYGTSGYSMGGGGTTIASASDPTLLSSVGLAPWAPTGTNVTVPTLLLCGATDGTAPCSMAEGAYLGIADSTPKMMVTIPATDHFGWFGPTDAGGGISGETALAFQKVFLEGDERWRPWLLQSRGSSTTNIQ
jgi:pimeloyl-ACP methyl ester carboxylesterase